MKTFSAPAITSAIAPARRWRRGYTLIELMVVVAIIGLMAAVGLPSILTAMQKTGMRKALYELQQVCATARANAIIYHRTEAVIFHPHSRSFAAEGGPAAHSGLVDNSTLPDGVELALEINQQDYTDSDPARVFFYSDGTCDEMVAVLVSHNERHKITLDFATGMPTVSDVTR